MSSEDQLIERVCRRFRSTTGSVRIGIGDDAAILRPKPGTEWAITTDAFLENVHFLRKIHPPDAVGYKALARATSDIAAMGARARCFFLTLGLPDTCTGAWLDDFLDGMARASRRFGLALAGGDTTKYASVVMSLTVLGEVDRGRAILRSGAKPGDLLCVSGRLGEAELGLRLIEKKVTEKKLIRKNLTQKIWPARKRWGGLLEKHYYPEPRLALGEWLAAQRLATSMIDTSDGLSTDLGHICKSSGVGAVVSAWKIPAVQIPEELRKLELDPLDLALHGGEDYELLFTVPKRFAGRLPAGLGGVPLTVIGEMTREKNVVLMQRDGSTRMLQSQGWDPFRKQKKK